jgi:hypothetical protein
MRLVNEKNPGYVCVPVAESGCTPTQEFQCTVGMDFSSHRGFRAGELRETAESVQKLFPNSQLHAVLDYFWLENAYYVTRYGGRWVTNGPESGEFKGSKVFALQQLGFSRISLPYNGGERNKSNSHMGKVLPTLAKGTYDCISATDEPLWTATDDEIVQDVMVNNTRGNHTTQTTDYLSQDTDCQFIVFRSVFHLSKSVLNVQ